MKLSDYLKRPDAPTLTALSQKIGVSKARLSQLRDEGEWPAELALKVETATDGVMSASELSRIVEEARRSAT